MPPSPDALNVCLQCGTPNEAQKQFCTKCGAPIAAFSVYGPMETVFAEGFMYRQASKAPRKPIVVIGIWLLMLPALVFGFEILFAALTQSREPLYARLLMILMGSAILWIPLTLVLRSTANYRAAAARQKAEDAARENAEDAEDPADGEPTEPADRSEPNAANSAGDDEDDESWRVEGYGTDAEERPEDRRSDEPRDGLM
jgi:hypothetical protein